ncbi:uncharacterized protein JN550_006750 [Neoarthrinium moseri]|uniref:uncharacterized protein n=1 Tax=Neoarthrinium moseri TaxID=1658444 RepID=UPI001FDE69B0|nr:uncharacterized protein JN550_006750 [Neoarthrinium moseri]KAI1867943.1 hypothetical protein JN550_006750 [Neoarthrinium moseri]
MFCLTYLLFVASAYAVLLPNATGPYSVGVSVHTLTDATRMDPYAPDDKPHERKVLISAFVPLNSTTTPCVSRSTLYMTPLVARDYDTLAASAGLSNETFTSLRMQLCDIPRGKSCFNGHGQRPDISKPSRPLLLFSPGFGQSRLLYGAMARSLASEGYVVITVDHPYDASVVEFPDGSFTRAANISTDDIAALEMVIQVRASDISFVIDQLQNVTALRQSIDHSAVRIDFDRIIMYGHSLGGAAAAATMLSDKRIRGGVNLDGRFFSPVKELGLERPFLDIGRPNHRSDDPTWDEFQQSMRAQSIELAIAGTTHSSFTDYPLIVSALGLTETAKKSLEDFLGTGQWDRVGDIIKRLVVAFDDLVFEHKTPKILQGADTKFPEVELVRSKPS